MTPERRLCERCGKPFVVPARAPGKRYCEERCQRAAEKERYRNRHTETAMCKGCGKPFERTTTTQRLQVFCKPKCQYGHRRRIYRQRPDMQASIRRAQRISAERRRGRGGGAPRTGESEPAGEGRSESVRTTDSGAEGGEQA